MTLESLYPLLQWITDHPMWSGFVVFLISLSESLAVVGLVVPGVILMTAIGSLIGAGRLPGLETMLWAMLGAIAGDGLSYWLGHHYQHKLKDLWPFKKFPNWLDKGTLFFKLHGGKSIILGRFIGPIRPTIPVIAGIMGMRPRTFLFFNIVSAIAWAPIYCLPGILIGASLGQLSPKTASTVLSLILSLLFIVWLIFYLLLKIIIYIKRNTSNFFRIIWISWVRTRRFHWLQHLLITAKDNKKGQLGTAFLFLLSVIAFVFIFICVSTETSIVHWNEFIHQCCRSLYTSPIANWAIIFISFGDLFVILCTVTIASIWVFLRHKATAIYWLGTILIGIAIGQYYQIPLNSVKPDALIQPLSGYSCPNRVLLATLTYGLAAAFASQIVLRRYRWIVWLISLSLIGIVALASIYIGLYWFTDVLGGLTLGMACVTLGLFFYRRLVIDYIPLKRLLIAVGVILVLSVTGYNLSAYKDNKIKWQRQWAIQTLDVNKWWTAKLVLPQALYRSSITKQRQRPFNLNWLGNLEAIRQTLQDDGWTTLPKLTLESSLMFLSEQPSTGLIPVLPKFHRDRLPALMLTKVLQENQARIVLQLWASDYVTTDNIPLWVGTIRLESIECRVPFITFYLEKINQFESYIFPRQFINFIAKHWQYKRIQVPDVMFLIAPEDLLEN